MTPKARVLVLAKDDRLAGPLADGLDKLDWKTITARGPHAALAVLADLQVDVVVIDASEGEMDAFTTAARMKAAYAPRRLPILALGAPGDAIDSGPFDLVMTPPLHPAQVAMRLDAMVRLAVAEEEFDLRAKTFAERGGRCGQQLRHHQRCGQSRHGRGADQRGHRNERDGHHAETAPAKR